MIGLIAGDIIGSAYERHNTSRYDFDLFTPQSTCTDDSVLACACAEAVLDGKTTGDDIAVYMHKWMDRYPHAGYGPGMLAWHGGSPIASKGNGAAVRGIGVHWAAKALGMSGLDEGMVCLEQATITHDELGGIRWPLVVSLCLRGWTHHPRVERPTAKPGALASESVPAAIWAAREASSWEDAVRRAVQLGGDSDSIAAIAGGLAEVLYGGVPAHITDEVRRRAPDDILEIARRVGSTKENPHHG